ncbi:serine hydrolase [Streptococcus sp. 121]|uniref:serine hydrolase n=1 Tax=Streptococcus sp. 121 TaxID=2797637 RepID=UPI0018F082C7|nr:serine hydrolase [Streptococcus sp. 121]MBJ6745762.1 serine hydrolase [Streptococcus sp. 121]
MLKTSKHPWVILPVLAWFTSWPFVNLDPAEKLNLAPEQAAALFQVSYSLLYTEIPENPVATVDMVSFKDQDLTQVAKSWSSNQALLIQDLLYRDDGTPLFQLKDGSFILASRSFIYSNQLLHEEDYEGLLWLQPDAKFYKEVPQDQSKVSKRNYQAYQPIKIVKKVTYPRTEYGVTDKGDYVDWSSLSKEDNRMQRVQELLDEKYQDENVGIYVQQVETSKVAGINQNKAMYSASITKLPYLYYVQEQVLEGNLKWTDRVKYTKETEDYDGAYDPAGTGSLPKEPNQESYNYKELEDKAAKESDNVAHNILGYYGTDKSSPAFQKAIKQIVGQEWDVVDREVTPEMAGRLMEAIYLQNGELLSMLQQTAFDDQRIPRDLPVPVAHKIGDADAFHHDAALVYAKSPYVLVIFTENKDNELISKISKDIYEVLK